MAVKIQENVNLAKYTTFQIGGNADYFCRPADKNELLEALNYAKENEMTYRVIGGGSNLLISDKGFRGLIILNRQGEYSFDGDRLVTDSGVSLSKLARETVKNGYAGLEFAQNIPGTIGGATAGNAGAYGKDMSGTVLWAEVWKDGTVRDYLRDDFMYDYRTSRFKNDSTQVILSVTLELERGNKEQMLELANKDVAKRSTDYAGASAGSYFTNIRVEDLTEPQLEKLNKFVIHGKVVIGKIIDHMGLKGLKAGGAMVSENHAGVILNVGKAKAADVVELERTLIDKVLAAYGIVLRPEVTKIGEF